MKSFDIIAYLESRNLEYWTDGKNVSQGWVNIQCPFCSDHSNHLGIHLENKGIHCWICGTKGGVSRLIKQLEGRRGKTVREVVSQFGGYMGREEEPSTPIHYLDLPIGASKNFPKKHLNYLRQRGYNPHYLINRFDLYACHTVGRYRWRIIAPFFLAQTMVTFTSVDVTGKGEKKYLHYPDKKSVMGVRDTFYNIDEVENEDRVIIVEGLFDVFRIDYKCIGLMGTKYSNRQINMLLRRNFKKVLIAFDGDSVDKADKLGEELVGVIPIVDVVELDREDDPDSLPPEEIKNLKKILDKD